jgi:hypothetical protein
MSNRAEAEQLDQVEAIFEPRATCRQLAINAGRDALLELRDSGQIGDEVRREVERSLDLQELQFSA